MDIITESTEKGVTERRFDLKVDSEVVPGILWEPEQALADGTPRPTILLNPGGHVQMPPFERQAAEDFFRRHLLPAS